MGFKRKSELAANVGGKMGPSVAKKPKWKPKTLSEKRMDLEQQIMKYGVAAIEKMYPRNQSLPQIVPKHKRTGARPSPIKMKPKTMDFEEIDVRKILKPFSHDKYIHEPYVNSAVYINRRKGIVPLSSLCKDSETCLSSNVKLLAGRNVKLGKPGIFINERGRMLALGGSREKFGAAIQVFKVPQIIKKFRNVPAFKMDNEFVEFAISALRVPKRKPRIDIRTLKKLKKTKHHLENDTDLKTVLKDKSIVDHVF